MNIVSKKLKILISSFIILSSMITAVVLYAFLIDKEGEKVVVISSNTIYYQNDGPKSQFRYKYITDYEYVDGSLLELSEDDPVYSLIVNGETVSNSYRNKNIPDVSSVHTVDNKEALSFDFQIALNEKINKELIRVDVKIIIEELKSGKWSPVYQVIFMERGPYWSLDKGPIETIKTEEN